MLRTCLTIIGLALALSPTAAPAQQTDADGFRPIAAWHAYRGVGVPPQWVTKDWVIDHTPGGGDLTSDEVFAISNSPSTGGLHRAAIQASSIGSARTTTPLTAVGPNTRSSTMPRRKAATIHCSRRRAATASMLQRPCQAGRRMEQREDCRQWQPRRALAKRAEGG